LLICTIYGNRLPRDMQVKKGLGTTYVHDCTLSQHEIPYLLVVTATMTWKLRIAMHRVNIVPSSEVSLCLCCRQLTALTVLWRQWLYTWMPRDTKILPHPPHPGNTLYGKRIKELQNRLCHLCGHFHYCRNNWRLLSTVRNIWHHCSSFLEGSKHRCEYVLYSGHCCLWFECLFRLCASPVSFAASSRFRSHPGDLSWLVFTALYSFHQQLQSGHSD